MSEQEIFLDYEQHLSEKLRYLYFKDARYGELRKLLQSDKEIVFAVRKDEIHIYYFGGRILKITKCYNDLKFDFDIKYAKQQKNSNELNEYGDIINKLLKEPKNTKLWVENFDILKLCMKNYRKNVSHNEERQLQQVLELANRDFNGEVVVIDNEYGVRKIRSVHSKLCKVDLVALINENNRYGICLIELKRGDGSIDGKAGVADHIYDFKTFLDCRRADIIASANNLIEYKNQNNSLYNVPYGLKLGQDTKVFAAVLCYDLSASGKKIVQASIERHEKDLTFKLHYNLDLKSGDHTLLKKDILT